MRQTSPDAERTLWHRLRSRQLGGYKFRRQHPIAGFYADFACIEAGLVVELDGSQHLSAEGLRADERRTQTLYAAGFHVIRFDDRQAMTETDAVLQTILDWLVANRPHPNPLPQAGEGVTFED